MLKAGFINFMPFGLKGDDYYNKLKEYAEIGYKGFENGTTLLTEGDPLENLARVKSYGIEPIDIGEQLHGFQGPAATEEEVIEAAHKLGVTRITCFDNLASNWRFTNSPDPVPQPSYDDVMKQIEEFERKATIYAKEGLDLMYHNHDAEFTLIYRGEELYKLVLANTENLKFELDCGWATYGGSDPVKLIHQMGKRISALHLKDYQPGITVSYGMGQWKMEHVIVPQFTAVGSGCVNIIGCLKAGDEEGIEWAIVEQDFMNKLDQKNSLICAYLNMKESGYVE